jgi:SagB-type dehydrogenase family enzyme
MVCKRWYAIVLFVLGVGCAATATAQVGGAGVTQSPSATTVQTPVEVKTDLPTAPATEKTSQEGPIDLPAPVTSGTVSLEETLAERRSVRSYTDEGLTWGEIGQLLWAAQGINRDWGARTAPSAGALYPLEVYLVTRQGLHHYDPLEHAVDQRPALGLHDALWKAGLKQDAIRDAPAVYVIAAAYARTEAKYGDRAERYVHLEAGHAAQNLLLQAVALDLGAVVIGAFNDDQVQKALDLPEDQAPLYLIPVGHPNE